jgi:hypothetical protein
MSIPQRLHNEVMMTDNFTCVYCGRRGTDMTIDHFIPQSQGGPDMLANLMTACMPCNLRKSDKPAHEVRMAPRYGRFSRAVRSTWSTTPPKPLTRDNANRIAELARERKEDGAYLYSANAIAKMVRAGRNVILDEVAKIWKGDQPESANHPAQRLERPANGWGKAS